MTSRQRHQHQAIVVGEEDDRLCQQAVAWLQAEHWKVDHGKHIYSASALLGRANADQVLVMGPPDALVRHGGDLLRLIKSTGALACGLLSGEDRRGWSAIAKMQVYGLPVFTRLEALCTWLKPLVACETTPQPSDRLDFVQTSYRTTKAELSALLDEDGMQEGPVNEID